MQKRGERARFAFFRVDEGKRREGESKTEKKHGSHVGKISRKGK